MLQWYSSCFLPGGLSDPRNPLNIRCIFYVQKKTKKKTALTKNQQQSVSTFVYRLTVFITDQCQKMTLPVLDLDMES